MKTAATKFRDGYRDGVDGHHPRETVAGPDFENMTVADWVKQRRAEGKPTEYADLRRALSEARPGARRNPVALSA